MAWSSTAGFHHRDRWITWLAYWSLVDLFESHVDPRDELKVLAGATAVYGWMPRMSGGLKDHRRHVEALVFLASANADEAHDFINGYGEQEQLLRLVSGSVVGTSKFLHFLNPRAVPIWDSRVARSLGVSGEWRVNRVDRFLSYWSGLNSCQVEAPPAFETFCSDPRGGKASRIRLMEFALYLSGAR